MTLELLICTIDEGIQTVAEHVLPEREDVRYLVSCQYTTARPPVVPQALEREDVTVTFLPGKGLCRNRNHAFSLAQGDILKICDDDEVWMPQYFDAILSAYAHDPELDLAHFQAIGPRKVYPPSFVSSFEITVRRSSLAGLQFDEHFGLGSQHLCAGEEDVFMHDARQKGLHIRYIAQPICQTDPNTTGTRIENPLLQRSKGAVYYRTGGLLKALCLSTRESLGWMVRRRMNPLKMFRNMLWGINYIRKCQV